MPVRWRDAILSEHGPERAVTQHVLLVLASFMNREGVAWPGQRKLSKTSRLAQKTIMEHVAYAEAAGWIVRSFRGRGPRAGHKYQAVIPVPILLEEVAE